MKHLFFFRDQKSLILLGAFAGIFWLLRISYWTRTAEIPFSDMNDYLMVTHNILDQFNFSMDSFWQSYKPPGLPVFGALVFSIFGRDNFDAYRVALGFLVFCGAIGLALQVYLVTNKRWIAFLFLFAVAISKSSIFWSYKFSTESLAEGLLYISLAISIAVLRRPTPFGLVLLGVSLASSLLNRPQYAILVPVFILIFLVFHRQHILQTRGKIVVYLAAFGVGLALIWGPWILRSYKIYGYPMLGNTSTPFNFLFELGPVKLIENGTVVEVKECMGLLTESRTRFANDYDAHLFGGRFVRSWISENMGAYFDLILKFRIHESLFTDHIHLTKVSRHALFGNILDRMLPDRSVFYVLFGFLYLMILSFRFHQLWVIPASLFASWAFSILFLSTARLIEPVLPILIFASWVGILVFCRIFMAKVGVFSGRSKG